MQGVYLVANMVEQVHSTSLRENTAECPYSLEKSPSATVQEQNDLCTEANFIAQASFFSYPSVLCSYWKKLLHKSLHSVTLSV